MASAISVESVTTSPKVDIQDVISNNPTGAQNVVRFVTVGAGAAPSSITIYDVPGGKSFLVTKITGANSHTFRVLNLYDSDDNTLPSGKFVVGAWTNDYSKFVTYQEFANPVVFNDGITIDVSSMTANQDYILQIEGILV